VGKLPKVDALVSKMSVEQLLSFDSVTVEHGAGGDSKNSNSTRFTLTRDTLPLPLRAKLEDVATPAEEAAAAAVTPMAAASAGGGAPRRWKMQAPPDFSKVDAALLPEQREANGGSTCGDKFSNPQFFENELIKRLEEQIKATQEEKKRRKAERKERKKEEKKRREKEGSRNRKLTTTGKGLNWKDQFKDKAGAGDMFGNASEQQQARARTQTMAIAGLIDKKERSNPSIGGAGKSFGIGKKEARSEKGNGSSLIRMFFFLSF
jgi:hypothetical protein